MGPLKRVINFNGNLAYEKKDGSLLCGQLLPFAEMFAELPWHSGVMPCADTCLSVEKVHLALLRGPLLCKKA